MLVRALSGAAVGAVLGVVTVAIAAGATAALSHFTQTAQEIPYLFQAAWAEAGQQTQRYYSPDETGMLAVVLLFALAGVLYAVFAKSGQRRKSSSKQ
ncbi:hypothetical protein [Nocardiopsis oceani]